MMPNNQHVPVKGKRNIIDFIVDLTLCSVLALSLAPLIEVTSLTFLEFSFDWLFDPR